MKESFEKRPMGQYRATRKKQKFGHDVSRSSYRKRQRSLVQRAQMTETIKLIKFHGLPRIDQCRSACVHRCVRGLEQASPPNIRGVYRWRWPRVSAD